MIKDKRYSVGKIIAITSGCYSSFAFEGVFEVIKSFTPSKIVARGELAKFNKFKSKDTVDYDEYLDYLVDHSYLRQIDMDEEHLGEYHLDLEIQK